MLRIKMDKDNKVNKGIILILSYIAIVIVSLFLTLVITWTLKTWNKLTMEELLYHLTTNLKGTGNDIIQSFILSVLVPLIVILFILIIYMYWAKNKKFYKWTMLVLDIFSIALLVSSVIHCWKKLEITAYLNNQSRYSVFIEKYNVNPKEVKLTFPEKKRNLIYIFLESTEMTFADKSVGGAFNINPISPLVELSNEGVNFSSDKKILNGANVLPGCTWTMAGMFCQTTGLPLKIIIGENLMNTQETFFSDIVSLGDILSDAGYNQTLLIGSDADFGGRKLFFTEHGNYDIRDYIYAQDEKLIPKGYKFGKWGYEDQRLFEFAKQELKDLAEKDKPFNLTMLTVDTHFEDGTLCSICKDDKTYGDDQYSTVFSCNSKQVYDFVEWVKQQDFYDNTTIVLCGDHLTMDRDYTDSVEQSYNRRVYTNIINSAVSIGKEKERVYSTLDLFPTTLAALNVDIPGNKLGLGVNLFSEEQTILERFGYDEVAIQLERKSRYMNDLANIKQTDKLKEAMEAGE